MPRVPLDLDQERQEQEGEEDEHGAAGDAEPEHDPLLALHAFRGRGKFRRSLGLALGRDPSLKLDEAETVLRTQIARLRRLIGHDVPILLIGPPDAASNRPEVALPGMAETVNCGSGWYVPGNLARVRQLQIRLAQIHAIQQQTTQVGAP